MMAHIDLEMFSDTRIVERTRNLDANERRIGFTERKLSNFGESNVLKKNRIDRVNAVSTSSFQCSDALKSL